MVKLYLVLHKNSELFVFDMDTDKEKYLERVVSDNKSVVLDEDDKKAISLIADGRYDDAFPRNGGLRTMHIGNVVTYMGSPAK